MNIYDDDKNFYTSLLNEGVDICELLRGNSGNVGSVGELLELAADEIELLRNKLETTQMPR